MKRIIFFCVIMTFYLPNLKAQTVSTFIDSDSYGLYGLTIEENFLYVVSSFNGKVYRKDINTSDSNYETFNIGGSGYEGICKVGDYLYVAKPFNGSYGIHRFNIENGTPIEQFISMNNVHGITHRDSELYIGSENGIYKVDLDSENISPILISNYGSGIGLKVYDNYLYTGSKKINLDSGNYEAETITTYSGNSFTRGNDENTFYLTGGEDYSAVYELNILTQTYSLLIQIENFIGTYDIIFADNSLFVTTIEGDYDKVARIDLNPLNVEEINDISHLMYPNPTSYFININGTEPNETITIINPNGQIVKSIKIENEKIDVSDLNPGVYFMKNKNTYKKFIKK
ncbi:hypothetical protein J2X31_001355 [Flavobacterium arsenatis]|uniref:Secretion system C-terminal sorting domain-containing protein n=1 Tax=Flavobacterium arsenatis TaxID=1484332 RepID=A0ABU1TN03_9FLAO|nr:T9SS type A sorting domain-containing protein [Flavobacterium arsenatis]MDR6967344.1 hypothetical protein [Flavobacterium arsenatis]